MQREINRVFGDFFRSDDDQLRATSWSPAVDISENDDNFIVNMELPGVPKDNLKIKIELNVLTVSGEKKQEREDKQTNAHRIERSYGTFSRSFTLPSNVKNDKIDALYQNGILTITVPKAEEAKPKAIEVKVT
jgi:HSP20 family protein